MSSRNCRIHGRAGAATSRGFNLIELLVVVSIISLLAAILFDSVSGFRPRPRKRSQNLVPVESKAKQAGLAAILAGLRRDKDARFYRRTVGQNILLGGKLGTEPRSTGPEACCSLT